jgi:hypothetical protein
MALKTTTMKNETELEFTQSIDKSKELMDAINNMTLSAEMLGDITTHINNLDCLDYEVTDDYIGIYEIVIQEEDGHWVNLESCSPEKYHFNEYVMFKHDNSEMSLSTINKIYDEVINVNVSPDTNAYDQVLYHQRYAEDVYNECYDYAYHSNAEDLVSGYWELVSILDFCLSAKKYDEAYAEMRKKSIV